MYSIIRPKETHLKYPMLNDSLLPGSTYDFIKVIIFRQRHWASVCFVLWNMTQLGGCASESFNPQLLATPDELTDVQTKIVDDVSVSVAILNDEQAQTHYGVDLGAAELQSLWVKIRNESSKRLWFIQNTVDRDFYTADEAALMLQDGVPDDDYPAFRQMLRDQTMRVMLPPKSITEGYIILPRAEGGRYVDIRLSTDAQDMDEANLAAPGTALNMDARRAIRMGFAVPLPDGIFDYERLDTRITYAGQDLPDLNREDLRKALEALPCCVNNSDGDEKGDPLNIVIVAEAVDLLNSLSRSGWSFTHRITFESIRRMIGAALQKEAYPVAPVSSLYLFGREQDFALQRARQSIAQRNHMRFWLAPFTYRGTQVWVGQISRDIGIKLSAESPTLTTHIIDPEVDQAREYLLHSLLAEGFVESFGFVKGSAVARSDEPATNLSSDPYFSDGMRLVVVMALLPQPLFKVKSLQWERSMAPIAEGQSAAAEAFQRLIPESEVAN
jgi:hypothetical protein